MPVDDGLFHDSGKFQRMMAEAMRLAGAESADMLHILDRRMIDSALLIWRRPLHRVALTLQDVGLLCPIATCLLSTRLIPTDCGQSKLWRECGPEYESLYGEKGWKLTRAAKYGLFKSQRGLAKHMKIVYVSRGLKYVYDSGLFSPWMWRIIRSIAPDQRGELGRRFPLESYDRDESVLFVGKQSVGKGWGTLSQVLAEAPCKIASVNGERHELVKYKISRARAVVIPSIQCDGLPRVGLEAAAAGTPIIGSRVGGIPEIVEDGVNGFTFQPADVAGLRQAIELVLKPGSMSDPTSETILPRFSAETACASMEEFYEADSSDRRKAKPWLRVPALA